MLHTAPAIIEEDEAGPQGEAVLLLEDVQPVQQERLEVIVEEQSCNSTSSDDSGELDDVPDEGPVRFYDPTDRSPIEKCI